MDGLADRGIALLVGPLEGSPDALVVMRKEDPRSGLDLLRTKAIMPWMLRIGSLPDVKPA